MGDVAIPNQWNADDWRTLHQHRPPAVAHTEGVVTGRFAQTITCPTCQTICPPRHEPMTLTDNETGETRTIAGAYVGPPDDPHRHFFPFRVTPQTEAQDDTSPQL